MGKIAYKIRNWKQYNRAWINRGNLTLWIPEDLIENWYESEQPVGRGRPFTYSDTCIQLALTLRSLFQFPLRATQGFLEGLAQLMRLDLKVPHYSQLSRRAGGLDVQFLRKEKAEKLDLVIDSTGLEIYGEGEWRTRIHGKQKRRTWRKYHVAVDPATHEVVAMELTEANVHDADAVADLIKNLTNIGNVYGDGAYPLKQSLDKGLPELLLSSIARPSVYAHTTGTIGECHLPYSVEQNQRMSKLK